ncbi:MAG: hypothetical protein GC162_14565 [Planctomycetes bacterium]|nr:hypothetical protein [Planctomycetota bacterium]
MSHESEKIGTPTPSELLRDIAAAVDGTADAPTLERLERVLMTDAQAMMLYRTFVMIHCRLRSVGRIRAHSIHTVTATPARSKFNWRYAAGLAAALAILMSLWFTVRPPTGGSDRAAGPAGPKRGVALLTNTENAVFADDFDQLELGGALEAGPIRLVSGTAQIMFKSSAVVDLTGPCEFEMTGNNSGKLTAGRLEAYVRPEARGFAVDLPGGARIVDLGTRFSVKIDALDGAAIRVIEGSVRLKTKTDATVLIAGQTAQLHQGVVARVTTTPGLPVQAGLTLWLSAEHGVETDAGGRVVRWNNRAASGQPPAFAAPPSVAPRFAAAAIAARPAVRFNADGSALSTEPFRQSRSQTILAVLQNRHPQVAQTMIWNSNGPPTVALQIGLNAVARIWDGQKNLRSVSLPLDRPDAPMLLALVIDDQTRTLKLCAAGQTQVAALPDVTFPDTVAAFIGSHPTGAAPFDGDLAELLHFSRALNDDELNELIHHFQNLYSLNQGETP